MKLLGAGREPNASSLLDRIGDVAYLPLCKYTLNILMPTSVHIPKPLLDAVDQRARALQVSRNHLIVLALERAMKEGTEWSPGFFEQLVEVDATTSRAVEEMLAAVKSKRRSKEPQKL